MLASNKLAAASEDRLAAIAEVGRRFVLGVFAAPCYCPYGPYCYGGDRRARGVCVLLYGGECIVLYRLQYLQP